MACSQQLAQDLVQVSLYQLPKMAGSAEVLPRLTESAEVAGEIAERTDGLSVEGSSVSELTELRLLNTGAWLRSLPLRAWLQPASANFGPTQKMVRNRRQYQTRTFRDTWPACFRPMPMTEANRPKFRPVISSWDTQGLRLDRKCFPCQQEQPWHCVASSSEVPRRRRRDLRLAALLLRLCGALCVLAVASSFRTLCMSSG